jgi:glutamate dehydrogenase
MHMLEDQGKLDRQMEFLPAEEEIQDRRTRGQHLTIPEISVLTSYVKGVLKEELATSSIVDDAYISDEMMPAFPKLLVKKYAGELRTHRLRRELVATQLANSMINFMGMNFVSRMTNSTGANTEAVTRAYIAARDVFGLQTRWDQISALDFSIDHEIQKQMMMDVIRLVRRVTRWLIRNRRRSLQLEKEIPIFRQAYVTLLAEWGDLLTGTELENWKQKKTILEANGVPAALSTFVAATHHLYSVMGIVEATARSGESTQRIAEIYFELGEVLQLNWFSRKIHEYHATSKWQALARETLQDDLNWQQAALTLGVVAGTGKSMSTTSVIERWVDEHQTQVDRWMLLQSQMNSSDVLDPAMFTVGIRELLDLAQSSRGVSKKFG